MAKPTVVDGGKVEVPLEVQKRWVVREQKFHPPPLLECRLKQDWRKIQVRYISCKK